MPITRTVKVGDVTLAKIAHGLMSMTWTPNPVSDEVAFETIKASLDALPAGVKIMLNSAEFYGEPPHGIHSNLELVSRFFEKYPEYTDKAFLSVKGGTQEKILSPDGSPQNLRRSVNKCIELLRGFKKIDLFEPARIDPNVPLEIQMKELTAMVNEGKLDYIGLSECSEASLRQAHAFAPVSIVEIEISPISYEEETKKVIAACAELGVAIVAYSPVGRGLLTGAISKLEDIPENDHRRRMDRFKPENIDHNTQIALVLKKLGESKGRTAAQIALAWVSALGPHVIPLPGWSRISRSEENLGACDIVLTEQEVEEIDLAMASHPVKGGRAIAGMEKAFRLWG